MNAYLPLPEDIGDDCPVVDALLAVEAGLVDRWSQDPLLRSEDRVVLEQSPLLLGLLGEALPLWLDVQAGRAGGGPDQDAVVLPAGELELLVGVAQHLLEAQR